MTTLIQADSATSAYRKLARALIGYGQIVMVKKSDDLPLVETKELRNVIVELTKPKLNLVTCLHRKQPLKAVQAEFLWYMQETSQVAPVLPWLPRWEHCAVDGQVQSNYGWHWGPQFQELVQRLLKSDGTSRQAVVNIYDKSHAGDHTKMPDVPCTMHACFSVRDQQWLDMTVVMRSNDLVWGFCNDQFCWSMFQQLLCNELRSNGMPLQVGLYTHMAHSMHVYARHFDLAKASAAMPDPNIFKTPADPEWSGYGLRPGQQGIDLQDLTYSNFWDAGQQYFDADVWQKMTSI